MRCACASSCTSASRWACGFGAAEDGGELDAPTEIERVALLRGHFVEEERALRRHFKPDVLAQVIILAPLGLGHEGDVGSLAGGLDVIRRCRARHATRFTVYR